LSRAAAAAATFAGVLTCSNGVYLCGAAIVKAVASCHFKTLVWNKTPSGLSSVYKPSYQRLRVLDTKTR